MLFSQKNIIWKEDIAVGTVAGIAPSGMRTYPNRKDPNYRRKTGTASNNIFIICR